MHTHSRCILCVFTHTREVKECTQLHAGPMYAYIYDYIYYALTGYDCFNECILKESVKF